MKIKTLYLEKNILKILDQRLLPAKIYYINCRTHKDVYRCIRDMAIRGAPAIGVAAGYGMYLASCEKRFKNIYELKKHLQNAGKFLITARPTAVNLSWAIKRINKVVLKFIYRNFNVHRFPIKLGMTGMEVSFPRKRESNLSGSNVLELIEKIKQEANKIYNEDIAINKRIGANGAKLLKRGSTVLTHCNAGALATAGWGTALGVIRNAYKQKKIKLVYVDETRPYLQGARLTTWELLQDKIPHVLITDNMAGHFMSTGIIDAVIVGADRIASNGDTANKIGTYSLAVLCKYNNIPFYVAAPVSTLDMKITDGNKIKIENRSSDEVSFINKKRISPLGVKAVHPAFDITPNRLITAIITEKGITRPPFRKRLKKCVNQM